MDTTIPKISIIAKIFLIIIQFTNDRMDVEIKKHYYYFQFIVSLQSLYSIAPERASKIPVKCKIEYTEYPK